MVLTVSLAVAKISPSRLISIALKEEPCAGIILTFPVDSSTSWTCPGVRPGNASVFAVKQQSPRGLSAVSKTAQSSGGLWNL
jgi:hypothetical protein